MTAPLIGPGLPIQRIPSAFSKVSRQALLPAGKESVPNWVFAADWDDRPDGEVLFGFRPLSNADLDFCRGEAVRRLREAHRLVIETETDRDLATEAYNDELVRLAVARGTCDPNDAHKPHPVWRGMGDDLVHEALTRDGARHLFDLLERATIAVSPIHREIQVHELAELAAKAPTALGSLPDWHARRIRRLLAYCLDEVSEATAEG